MARPTTPSSRRAAAVGVVEAKKVTVGPPRCLTPGRALLQGHRPEPHVPGRVRRAVPVLDQRRGDLVPRRPPRPEPLARGLAASTRRRRSRDAAARLRRRARSARAPSRSNISACGRTRSRPTRRSSRPSRERKRKMLVTMATGTGKTLMTVNEVYRLMKSGVARRVLFLVDRRALAAQTVRAFAVVRGRAGTEVRQDLPGLLAALPAGGLRRGRARSTRTSCRTRC